MDAALGDDLVEGGSGSDTVEYYGAEGGVVVNLARARAWETTVVDGSLPSTRHASFIDQLSSVENATGSFFADVLIGSSGANVLIGDGEGDSLSGGGGADRLIGGTGSDRLEGGSGADRFVFNEGDLEAADRDVIVDFSRQGGDRIDLSAIDASRLTSYDDEAFSYVGQAAFSGSAGELRAVFQQNSWQVSGDWDGDATADFTIVVASAGQPLAGDFIL